MKILLARITRSRKGYPIRAEQAIEGDNIAIGRGAQCAIHLSDPRVAFEHATLFTSGGARRVASVGVAVLTIDGRQTGDLELAPGSRFEVGPYTFIVEDPPPGVDVALSCELTRPLPDAATELSAHSTMDVEKAGLGKRGPAWTLFLVISIAFLVIPIVNAVLPPLRALTTSLKASPDVAWNPGPLAAGHQWLSFDCGACHQTPFLRVRDVACVNCHETVPGHVANAALQKQLFAGMRCAQCHLDHRGADEPVRADSGVCVPCHADIKRRDAGAKIANVSDFASAHPEFRLTLWRGPGPKDLVRIKQSDKAQLTETSNLKFPHDTHLKPNLNGPEGKESLDCASCHVADASERSFVPVNMDRHCLRCHELKFEPAVTPRQVPHGSVEDAWLLVQEFYANISLGNIPVDTIDTGSIRRAIPSASSPIITDEQRRRALAFARGKAQQVGVDLFEKRVCIVCHDVRRSSSGFQAEGAVPWEIAPVHFASTYMPLAHFDHSKHRTAQSSCKDCHRTERSHRSSDISLPDIADCRNCHAGDTPLPGKVVSTCIACHDFHLAGGPRQHPATARVAPAAAGEKK